MVSLARSSFWILLVVIMIAGVSAQTGDGAKTAAELNESRAKAFSFVRAGDYAGAHRLFDQILATTPGDYLSLYGNGLSLFNLRRPAEAEQNIESAIAALTAGGQDKRLLADCYVLSGVIHASQNKSEEAVARFLKALDLSPNNFDAHFSLGRAYFGNGDISGAVKSFTKSVDLRPKHLQARFFLATALERLGDSEAALSQYRQLITLDRSGFQGYLGLGVLLIKIEGNESKEGIESLEKAISLNGNLYEARITLGKALIRNGKPEESVSHLEKAAELAPNNPEPHYQLAIALRKLGRKTEAAEQMNIVKEIHRKRRGTN